MLPFPNDEARRMAERNLIAFDESSSITAQPKPVTATGTMEMPQVPQDLLLSFFQEACKSLNECKRKGPFSLADLRNLLLTNQRFCLDRVVDEYNLEHKNDSTTQWTSTKVQEHLKNLQSQDMDAKVKEAMEAMNDAARLAFCRLVLSSECLRQRQESEQGKPSSSPPHHLEKEDPIQRSQLLEFSGLCSAATRLPMVQNYVRDGTDLFDDDTTASSAAKDEDPSKNIPPYRLDVIQRLFFRAVQVDPDHGMAEIKRIFFSGENTNDELANDAELVNIFQAAVTRMNKMLTEIMQQHQKANLAKLNDFNDGGSTRVVSVEYSEKIYDERGQLVESGDSSHLSPVARQAMEQQSSREQQEQFEVARQAGAMQQEILGELFALSPEAREEKLTEAEDAEKEFLAKAMEIPAGPERISFLRSVDPGTQRLMVMRKLWQGMLAAHGGKPPKMQA
jgi:hypothetical protein